MSVGDSCFLHRRQLLQLGGLAALTALGAAACGSGSSPGPTTSTVPGATTTTFPIATADATALRLASSLEHYAISFYGLLAASEVIKTPTLVDAAKYFSDQHADHAGFFERATGGHGGQPFTTANPVVSDLFRQRVTALSNAGATEADVVKLAYDVESLLAATYLSTVGTFQDLNLNAAVMSVGGIEARHVAIFGTILTGIVPAALPTVPARQDSPPTAPTGFQTADLAVAPGTGV
jgi:hypothetical protein